MFTVGFITRKGGAGKTSTCHHVGAAIRDLGYRVLLVDMDPQASLTQGLIGTDKALALHPSDTVVALFNESGMALADVVRPLGRDDFALVAAHDDLYLFNETRPWTRGDAQYLLKDGLADVSGAFDFCLVDGPPHIQLMGWNLLCASDGVVIPAVMEEYGIHGVAGVLNSIDQARTIANPKLKLVGFLPTMYRKIKIHGAFERHIRREFGDDVFAAMVPEATLFKEAVTANMSIGEYRKESPASKAIEAVAEELVRRVVERCGAKLTNVTIAEGEAA